MSELVKSSKKAAKPAKPEAIGRDLGGEDEPRYKPIEWPLVKRLIALWAPYQKRYALGISLGTIMTILDMLGPQFMKHLVDYSTGFAAGKLNPMPTQGHAIRHVCLTVAGWACMIATFLVVHRFQILVMTGAGERVQFGLRRRIFEHLQRLSMNFYDKTKLGRIISRCTSDIGSMREVNVWGIDQIIRNSLALLVAAAMLAFTEWRLFLAVVWLGPVLYLMNHYYKGRISLAWQMVREHFTRVSSNLAENITGVRVVTAFNRQVSNLSAFDVLQERNTDNNIKAARINGIYQPLLQLVGFAGKVIILAYGGYMVANGRIPKVGAVIAALLYWDRFMGPILTFGNWHNQFMMAMAGAERVFSLLDMTPEVQDTPEALALPPVVGEVKFEHVTFGYNPDRPVLFDINLEAHPGQMVALVGHTGSGKSSMISLIARFYQPQQGRILVDGHDIRHVTGHSLHKQMGLVLQVNYLFSGTVMDNIRYTRPEASDDEVIAAAKAIGCYDVIMGLNDGFATQVGERGASMSLGQRQLICFARAYLANPRIFMLDEATSAVDTETELLVQRSLERLLEGRTTFIVAHRLSTILRADQILVVDQGRIVERGTHRELLDAGGTYAKLYEQFSQHGSVD